MKRLAVALIVFSLMVSTAWASPGRSLQAQPNVRSAGGHAADAPASVGVIVRFKQPSTAPLAAQLLSAITSSSAAPTDRSRGMYTFRTPPTNTDDQYAVQLMLDSPGVAYAEPNYVRQIQTYVSPTDPDYRDTATWYETIGSTSDYYLQAKHWWLDAMNASGAWSIGQGDMYPVHGSSSDIKVADLDTGIYLNHAEFNGGTVTAGKDEFASYDPNAGVFTTDSNITPDATSNVDFASHGTATAASVGAEVNGTGTVGSGWNAQVVGYKVAGPITSSWGGYPAGSVLILDAAVANGIYDAVNSGCKVINMSLGGTQFSQTYQDAINYAHSHGVVVCASAGNDGGPVVNYPAACTYVTGVGATARFGGSGTTNGTIGRATFSDYAPGVVDLVAPGEMFWTADRPGYVADASSNPGYQFWAGTSFSSPAVAGAIAYLWRAMPDLTNDQIVSYVESSAVDLGAPGRDDEYGYGQVDMQAAYNRLIADYPMLAKPTISAAPYVRTGSAVSWGASAGYSVSYRVSIEGTLTSTQASKTYALPALSDGAHLISILPTSTRNWNTTSLATATLTLDSTPPSVSGFALGASAVSWSVTEANPYTVQAYIDTATPAAVASNTLSISGLAFGPHTLHVNATDAAGNSSGWISWQIAPAAPVVPSVVATDALSATVSWPAVASAGSYDYAVNGGSTSSTAGPAFTLTGLTGGVTQVAVRSVTGGMASAWATATVTDNLVVPGVPAISAPATVGAPSATATWPAAPFARSYEYRLNGGTSTDTTATTATFASLPLGANAISVRSLDNLAQSAWATVTVTYAVPAPLPSAPATVWATTATVSWSAVPGATGYEYVINGGATTATTSTSIVAGGFTCGDNTVTLRTVQGANRSAWAAATITYSPPATTTLTLSPSAALVADPASSTTLFAAIDAPAETFRLQSSSDGSTWSNTGVTRTSTATPAPMPITVPVISTVYFRLVFDGDAQWAPATSNVVTVTYSSIVATPKLQSFVVTDTLSATVTWPAIAGAASYDYTLNGGSVQSTLGAAFVASGLSPGANTVQARTVNAAAHTSAWVTATVTAVVVVPSAPALSAPATVGAPSVTVSWAPSAYALYYQYRLDGGSSLTTTGTGVSLTLSATGSHVVEVRALDNLAQSDWATATVIYAVPAPSLSAPAAVHATTATVSWAGVPGATVYQYAIDGGSVSATSVTSLEATGFVLGGNTIAVRALQGANASDWATATITYFAPGAPTISLTAPSLQATYPTSAIMLVRLLGAPNEHVTLQSSTNGGATWSNVGAGWTTSATPAPVAVSVGISRSTSFRLVFAGDAVWVPATSSVVSVSYVPRIQTPSVPASVRRGARFTASVTLTQPAPNLGSAVTFQFSRWQKVSGSYGWVLRKSVRVKGVVSASSAMKYKATTYLSTTGSWRVVAAYTGAPLYANTSSTGRSLKVK